jgi:hypothetical protein
LRTSIVQESTRLYAVQPKYATCRFDDDLDGSGCQTTARVSAVHPVT